jgi:hypothetical protein
MRRGGGLGDGDGLRSGNPGCANSCQGLNLLRPDHPPSNSISSFITEQMCRGGLNFLSHKLYFTPCRQCGEIQEQILRMRGTSPQRAAGQPGLTTDRER